MTMQMKNGGDVPLALVEAFKSDDYAAAVFAKMRPSCQEKYAGRILEAKNEETAVRRAATAITQIKKYGDKHNMGGRE